MANPSPSSLLSVGTKAGAPLRKPWKNAIAVGRAYELLRDDVLSHLRKLQRDIGYRYCRFHGVFHDDMGVVGRRENGSLAFRWHQVDKIYDSLLEMGLRPFVELNPMPAALASGPETIFEWRMNVTPPRDYAEWETLVESFARHLVSRYGLDEVRHWYFEVWNEPNLSGFWSGTKEEYWKLYAASARALKRVSPALRVGGPATSKANWIGDIINHCTTEGLPLDFVSTHVYPQDEYVSYPDRAGSPHAPGRFFADTVRSVHAEVARSARPYLEIHWTEWNSLSTASSAAISWTDNQNVDSLFGAAMACEACVELDDACDSFCWWTASDVFEESGMPHAEFSCTYGMLTLNEIPKPSFHAFDFLNRLQGGRLPLVAQRALPSGCGGIATTEEEIIQVLLWHKIVPEVAQGVWNGRLSLPVAAAGDHLLIETRIAAGHGSAWETWIRLGSPQNPTRAEMRLLRAHAEPEYHLAAHPSAHGEAIHEFGLAPGEVCLIEFFPQGGKALPKGPLRKELEQWNLQMGAASKL